MKRDGVLQLEFKQSSVKLFAFKNKETLVWSVIPDPSIIIIAAVIFFMRSCPFLHSHMTEIVYVFAEGNTDAK